MKKYDPLKQFTVHPPAELNGSKYRVAIPLGAELWIKYFTIEYTLEQRRQEL